MATEKISITIDTKELAWLKKSGRIRQKTLSAMITEAARLMREQAAREEVLQLFGPANAATRKRMAAIEAEWRG